MLKRRMIRLLEKLLIQRDEIHREYGTSLRYTQDYQKRLSIIRKVLVQEKEMFEGCVDTTAINDAKRIISQMNTGNECDYMEAGYLYYGMGLYGYSNDVIKSGCEYTKGKNDLFSHLVPTIENVSNFIAYIHKELGIL